MLNKPVRNTNLHHLPSVTPDLALNEQCYWWEISGEVDALIIHSYTPNSDRMFTRNKAILGLACNILFL
jgi:hypothetical protein